MREIRNKYLTGLEVLFTEKVNQPYTIPLFKKAVYIFILLNGLITLPVADQIWSPSAHIIHYYPFDNIIIKVLNILSRPGINNYYLLFVIGQLLCCIMLLLGYMKRLMSVLLYFISANLYYNAVIIQNGGNNLLLIILFYLIFMNEDSEKHKNKNLKTIDTVITNFAFLAAQIQVCILYFVSAITKLNGTHWLDGSALYYVLNIDEYSTTWVQRYIANTDWLTIPATYFTFIFQLVFPITVWMKKFKPTMLLIGIALHLLIIFMMGLTDFGLIMIIMYLLFVDNKVCKRLLERVGKMQLAVGSWQLAVGSWQKKKQLTTNQQLTTNNQQLILSLIKN